MAKIKQFIKATLTLSRGTFVFLGAYFGWLLRYSNHPERYPFEERYKRVRDLINTVMKHIGAEVEIKGYENLDGLPTRLYVSNHISLIDPLLLIMCNEKPVKFVAKKEVAKMPLVGRILKALDCIFLDRDDPRDAIKSFARATEEVKNGLCSYVIYPEGTRNKDPYNVLLNEFHPGSLKIATRAKCPIVPISTFGEQHALETDEFNRSEFVQILFHPPLDAEEVASSTTIALAEKLQSIVASPLEEMREKDKAYMASPKRKKAPRKWWKEDKLPFSMEKRK